MVAFGHTWLYSGKGGRYSGEVVVIWQSASISVKVVLFRQRACIRAKIVVFGQKWFLAQSGCF